VGRYVIVQRVFEKFAASPRAIDRLGDQADFGLSHGAVPLAAEQVLTDIRHL
jgi:hypothetical protein